MGARGRGEERQLHLKVRVPCGKKEVIADALVDTGAQVSLVWKGLLLEEFLKRSRRPVRLKVAHGKIWVGVPMIAQWAWNFRNAIA